MLIKSEILKNILIGNIKISPFNESNLNPNSYNLTLDENIKLFKSDRVIDFLEGTSDDDYYTFKIDKYDGFILRPNELYLACSVETTQTDFHIPQIDARSSIGRCGLDITTARFGDIGYYGKWTFTLRASVPIKVYPNIPIAQIYFTEPVGIINREELYNGRYQNSTGISIPKSQI